MTHMRIEGDAIKALGAKIGEHALALRGIDDVPELGEGFVANAGPACRTAVTSWKRRRLALCDELEALAALAKDAGDVYLDTEAAVDRGMGRGHG